MSSDLFSTGAGDNPFRRYGFQEDAFATPERNEFSVGDVKENAVLFLYGPTSNKFNRTALFSRTYNFDTGTFAANLESVVNSVVQNPHGEIASIGRGVDPYDQFTYTPRKDVTLEANLLSENWTFTLVFTGKSNRISSSAIIATSAVSGMNRTVYSGVCSGEPFTTNGGKRVLNPHCRLEVLHKNQTAIDAASSRMGTTYTPRNKHTDWVFREKLFSDLVSRRRGLNDDQVDHHMSPAKLGSGIRQEFGSFYTVPGISTEIKEDAKIIASDLADDPKQHLSTITRGLAEHIKYQEHSKSIFGDADFAPASDEDTPDYVASAFSSALHIPTSGSYTKEDLDLTGEITMEDLDKMCDLHVHPKTFEDSTAYAADSATNNLINKLSYEIGTIVGIAMNRLGISSISFVYAREQQPDRSIREGFKVQRSGFIYKVSPEDGRRLRDMLEVELRTGVLRKIATVLGGDYHLTVNASVTDITTIRLNPLDGGQMNRVDYVIPNILGGMVSASIGSTADSAHNQERICDLLSQFVGGVENSTSQASQPFGNREVDNWDATYDHRPSWAGAPPSGHNSAKPEPVSTPVSSEPAPESQIAKSSIRDWDKF